MSEFEKAKEKILYHIYKKKYMSDSNSFRISDMQSEFITEYDRDYIIEIITALKEQKYIVTDPLSNFGIPNIAKFKEIERLFRCRRAKDWLKENIILLWQFIWKHFIVTILVSAFTAYIITRYIDP